MRSFLAGVASSAAFFTLAIFVAPNSRERAAALNSGADSVDRAAETITLPAHAPPPDQPVLKNGPLRARGSNLVIPVEGVSPEELLDTFTDARGKSRRHEAIDIAAPHGTPVLSVAPSTVLKLFQSVQGGTTLYTLAQDESTVYYYAHLDRYADGIVEGRKLNAGDVIGYVGDTGNAGAGNYHLHFGISTTPDPKRFWSGEPQNPYPLLIGKEAH
jgi:peptidoglycan LD-endopeptidase LytH